MKSASHAAVALPADPLRFSRFWTVALLLAAISTGALAGALLALRTLAEALP
jgi:hypothetical protein